MSALPKISADARNFLGAENFLALAIFYELDLPMEVRCYDG